MDNMILTFIVSFIIICIIGYLIKMSMKLLIVTLLIMILFGAGYIWGPNDLNEKLGLNKWLKPEYSQKVNDFTTVFDAKRKENSVLNQDEIKNTYNKTEKNLKEKSNGFIEGSGGIVTNVRDKTIETFKDIKNIIIPPNKKNNSSANIK